MYSKHPSRFDLANEALLQDQRLNQQAKSVYMMLVKLHVRCQATSWPGPEVLAAALASTPRAVRNALARLADLGYLERKAATRNSRPSYRFPRIEDGLLLSGVIAARHAQQTQYQHAVRIPPTSPDRHHSRLHCACHAPFEAERSMCTPNSISALSGQRRQLAAHPETGQE